MQPSSHTRPHGRMQSGNAEAIGFEVDSAGAACQTAFGSMWSASGGARGRVGLGLERSAPARHVGALPKRMRSTSRAQGATGRCGSACGGPFLKEHMMCKALSKMHVLIHVALMMCLTIHCVEHAVHGELQVILNLDCAAGGAQADQRAAAGGTGWHRRETNRARRAP